MYCPCIAFPSKTAGKENAIFLSGDSVVKLFIHRPIIILEIQLDKIAVYRCMLILANDIGLICKGIGILCTVDHQNIIYLRLSLKHSTAFDLFNVELINCFAVRGFRLHKTYAISAIRITIILLRKIDRLEVIFFMRIVVLKNICAAISRLIFIGNDPLIVIHPGDITE